MSPFPEHGRTGDQRLAEDLAAQAGRMLTSLRVSDKHGDQLSQVADDEAHLVVRDRLAIMRPDDAVLSEENPDDAGRLEADRVWIIDPLDGTRQYAIEGRPDWATHIALWERGGEHGGRITSCAIAMPAYGRVLTGRGATTYQPQSTIPGQRPEPLVPPRDSDRLRFAVSETDPPEFIDALLSELDADRIELGSAGAKTATVLEDETDAYLHVGGLEQWDSAAAVGVARQRGFHASRIDGSELVYNNPDAGLPDLLVCKPELSDRILEAIAKLS